MTTPEFAFGFGFDCQELETFTELAEGAERAGMRMIMTGDTPALLGDCYVGQALLAQHTSRARVGSFVTNPVTRHPVVAAAAASSIEALAPGRAFIGLGSGDSGVYNLGERPATLAQLEEYVGVLRDLWSTGESTYRGRTLRFQWSRRQLPIFLAPGGPRGLRLAGRIADGVVIETGVLPEVVDDALAHLRSGAEEAGRTLDDIEVWWHVRANLASSTDQAIAEIRSGLAGIGNRLLRFGHRGKHVPPRLLPAFQELQTRYQLLHHEESGTERVQNAPLVEELGLLDYLVERFALVGTPDDWITRLKELDRRGVQRFAIAAVMPDKGRFLDLFRERVLPAL